MAEAMTHEQHDLDAAQSARDRRERFGVRDAREQRLALARAKRSAWLLAAIVVVIYVGYFAWNLLDGR